MIEETADLRRRQDRYSKMTQLQKTLQFLHLSLVWLFILNVDLAET